MYEAMDNATRTEGRLRVLTSAVSRAAAVRPVVAGPRGRALGHAGVLAGVRALIDAAPHVPLLVVCTSRREGDPFGVPPLDVEVERWDLPPLATRDALALARSYLTANPNVARRLR